MLHQVFYLSRAAGQVADRDIQQILVVSRRNNWRHGITGCLLYSGSHFAQTLEGDETVMRDLIDRIARDPRHTDFHVLFDRPLDRRRFGEWSMGYLYDQGTADELARLSAQPAPAEAELQALMRRMELDPVMGGLQGGLPGKPLPGPTPAG
jgi:Sensors of blue-light using FAD